LGSKNPKPIYWINTTPFYCHSLAAQSQQNERARRVTAAAPERAAAAAPQKCNNAQLLMMISTMLMKLALGQSMTKSSQPATCHHHQSQQITSNLNTAGALCFRTQPQSRNNDCARQNETGGGLAAVSNGPVN